VSTATIDVAGLARVRHARLQAQLAERDVAAAVLLHAPHVDYATGLPPRGIDATHAAFARDVAVVVAGAPRPHLFTDRPAVSAGARLAVEHHEGLWPELDEGAVALGAVLEELVGDARVAVDELTGAMLRTGVPGGGEPLDAGRLVGAAKLVKAPEEIACIDEAQRITEEAMVAVRHTLVPGVHRRDLVGVFLAGLAERGAGANLIDPIFQPMPRRLADGPRTTTGDVAFPVAQRDWVYGEGDLVWVDAGVDHLGYASDYGRTWTVGREPAPEEQACFERWSAVVAVAEAAIRPGVSLGDVGRAAVEANDGEVPWLPHFYLAHGLGIESAEMPLVGTDLGPAFDDSFVLAEGMVLVLEPVVWHDGHGGYRSEEVTVVTEDGCRRLGGGAGYEPFE
jgi:Xaa-Pro aminopeptidase